jgi:hypothetical protein
MGWGHKTQETVLWGTVRIYCGSASGIENRKVSVSVSVPVPFPAPGAVFQQQKQI